MKMIGKLLQWSAVPSTPDRLKMGSFNKKKTQSNNNLFKKNKAYGKQAWTLLFYHFV